MSRKSIQRNVARQLWATCGGYCQNPDCNKFLFASVDEDSVSLANIAHIIGHGKKGPRSEHELSQIIDKDGFKNLIMLCLECHKIVDELEKKFSVEDIQKWKREHENKVKDTFNTPKIEDEIDLLMEINDLLSNNKVIFKKYSAYYQKNLNSNPENSFTIWRKKCLDTILPNNRLIINLIEKNKNNIKAPYPWDVYQEMLSYKLHVDDFEDSVLHAQHDYTYGPFPMKFDKFIKSKLEIDEINFDVHNEDFEYRRKETAPSQHDISTYKIIQKLLPWDGFVQDLASCSFQASLDGDFVNYIIDIWYKFMHDPSLIFNNKEANLHLQSLKVSINELRDAIGQCLCPSNCGYRFEVPREYNKSKYWNHVNLLQEKAQLFNDTYKQLVTICVSNDIAT